MQPTPRGPRNDRDDPIPEPSTTGRSAGKEPWETLEDPFEDDPFDDLERTPIDVEATYVCDRCGEEIVVPIDPTAGDRQEYVEDCPVCCHPNVLRVSHDGFDPTIDNELE